MCKGEDRLNGRPSTSTPSIYTAYATVYTDVYADTFIEHKGMPCTTIRWIYVYITHIHTYNISIIYIYTYREEILTCSFCSSSTHLNRVTLKCALRWAWEQIGCRVKLTCNRRANISTHILIEVCRRMEIKMKKAFLFLFLQEGKLCSISINVYWNSFVILNMLCSAGANEHMSKVRLCSSDELISVLINNNRNYYKMVATRGCQK